MKFAGGKIARLNHRPVIAPAHDVRNGVEAEATRLANVAGSASNRGLKANNVSAVPRVKNLE